MTREKTVGKIYSELLEKKVEKVDVVEQQQGMTEDYMKNLIECAETHLDDFEDDFYIVVITKNERLMKKIFRNYFLARNTCPTPEFDQTVYKYNREADRIEYVWTVPSTDACQYLLDNESQIPREEEELVAFVKQFFDDTLLKISKALNNEKSDSNILN